MFGEKNKPQCLLRTEIRETIEKTKDEKDTDLQYFRKPIGKGQADLYKNPKPKQLMGKSGLTKNAR